MSDDESRAELEAAQGECADLWDALDKARAVLDEGLAVLDGALAKIRRDGQAQIWADIARAVALARRD